MAAFFYALHLIIRVYSCSLVVFWLVTASRKSLSRYRLQRLRVNRLERVAHVPREKRNPRDSFLTQCLCKKSYFGNFG